jgi:uncharacterized membrane protein
MCNYCSTSLNNVETWVGFNFCCVSNTIFKLTLRKILKQGTHFTDTRSRVTVKYDLIDTAYQSCALIIHTRFSRWQSWHCYTSDRHHIGKSFSRYPRSYNSRYQTASLSLNFKTV